MPGFSFPSKFKRTYKIFLLLLSLLFCKPQSDFQDKNVLRLGISSEPSKLDPIFATDLSFQKISILLFPRLFTETGLEDFSMVQSYTEKPGGILRIKLKKLLDKNENSLNAEDVQYCLNRLRTQTGPKKSLYARIKSIKILGTNEVEIQFLYSKERLLELLSQASAGIYSRSIHEKEGTFHSAGPYHITHWIKNNQIELSRNPNFISNSPLPSTLILQTITESTIAIYLFSKNRLDSFKLPYFLSSHPATEKGKMYTLESRSVQYIAINAREKCFDISFRKALNYAVNKKLIIDKLFSSRAKETYASIPLDFYNNLNIQTVPTYPFDVKKAKYLLKQSACYPAILNRTLEFRMKSDDENKAKGAVLVQYLKNIGLRIKIIPLEKTKLYKENGEGKGDLTLLTWYIDYNSIYNFIDPLFYSKAMGNGGNRALYANILIDKFIENYRNKDHIPIEKQRKNLETITHHLYEEAPWIFLWSLDETYLTSNKFNLFRDSAKLFLF
ncbi:MAG: ABC transporter substrate-binding protein [Leptospiraceae bacterium]|nr:ABC transporter substrate-binding protein [Leptospiraceae bacterium]